MGSNDRLFFEYDNQFCDLQTYHNIHSRDTQFF
jgi:hypothetical protein